VSDTEACGVGAAVRRFLADLLGGPVTIQGISSEARVDTELEETRPARVRDEEGRAITGMLFGLQTMTHWSAGLRFLAKRFSRRQ